MKVLRAKHAGACYGVQRALDLAHEAIESGSEAYTLGPLIHNPRVVRELAQRGVHAVERVEDVAGGAVVIRSHGVTPQVRAEVEALGLPVIDATCPHVARAQKAAAKLAAAGCCVVVVGEEGHPEVEGLKEYARAQGARVEVVGDPAGLPDDLYEPVGVVAQTTQKLENVEAVVAALVAAGIEPQVKNTICFATRQRQDAATEMATRVDAMVVIGGRNSSNTTRLAEICAEHCARTYHVEAVEELQIEWFAGCETVGVTAGASTPEEHIQAVVAFIESAA